MYFLFLAVLPFSSPSLLNFSLSPEELYKQGYDYYYGNNGISVNKIKAVKCWEQAAEEGLLKMMSF